MSIVTSVVLPPVHPFSGMDVTSALEERVRLRGGHPFLIWEPADGPMRAWTYGEFAHDVNATAAGLAARGVGPGDAVMVHLDNCPGFLIVWFACARLGAVAVDVNARYSADEVAYAIEVTGAAGLITHERLVGFDDEIAASVGWIATLDAETGTVPELMGDPSGAPRRDPDPGAALCVQFTSGTTSRPKAVLYTHANALWGARVGASHWELQADTVQLVYAPLFHTMALSWQTLSTFWVGGTIVLQPKFSASRFWEVSIRHGCTHTNLLGLMMQVLAEQSVPEHAYRSWSFGMERPEFESRYQIKLFNAWGMTEVVTQPIIGSLRVPADVGAIGRAATEYDIRIRHDDGTDVKPGETGELLVRGVRGISVFAEYFGDPAATAAAFDDDGFFLTGDRVTLLPSGSIQFSSRAKDMLKVGGENVAASEIERVVLAVAGVKEAAVVALPDRMRDEVPVAFVILADGTDGEALSEQILALCREQLADFKVPRSVHVVDEFPRATLDKVAKATLRQTALDLAAPQ